MHARRIAITLGALVLSLGLAGSASAATATVDYDLSDTVFWSHMSNRTDENESNPVQIGLGSMNVVYTTDNLYQVQSGQATIQSLTLVWSGSVYTGNNPLTPRETPGNGRRAYWEYGTATCDAIDFFCYGGASLLLTAPVQGSVTAGGKLTAAGAGMKLRARVKDGTENHDYSFVQTGITFNVPVGSVASTHWLDGRITGSGVATPNAGGGTTGGGGHFAAGTGTLYSGSFAPPSTTVTTAQFGNKLQFPGEVTLVGREIQRSPAKIPEPGSLLLLGSGLAGLAALGTTGAVGHRVRRRRRS